MKATGAMTSTTRAQSQTKTIASVPTGVKFLTAGLGGIFGWWCIHPFNTCAVRLNLLKAQAGPGAKLPGFPSFILNTVKNEGVLSLYEGIGAGTIRQIFYATSRFGLFEVFRDLLEETSFITPSGELGATERLVGGLVSGGCAAIISCPCEVTLVRMSNDRSLPENQRRNYKNVADAARRILTEEGLAAFWRGSVPFAQRAMLVGACQVATFDQNKHLYDKYAGLQRGSYGNVFAAAMTSGLFYSLVTMPFESAKNRLASQKPDPKTGKLPYQGTMRTIGTIARVEGVLSLWSGFAPYYARCGGHTCFMFVAVEWMRKRYTESKSD
eukprot:g4643.t1